MRIGSIKVIASALLIASALPAFASPKVRRGPTATRLVKAKAKKARVTPQGIGPERATEIQAALIKAGYLTGTPSGAWDTPTQAAMVKLQADNGWQTKLVPDSRAIIKLGLGSSNASVSAIAPAFAGSESSSSEAVTGSNQ